MYVTWRYLLTVSISIIFWRSWLIVVIFIFSCNQKCKCCFGAQAYGVRSYPAISSNKKKTPTLNIEESIRAKNQKLTNKKCKPKKRRENNVGNNFCVYMISHLRQSTFYNFWVRKKCLRQRLFGSEELIMSWVELNNIVVTLERNQIIYCIRFCPPCGAKAEKEQVLFYC